MKTASRATFPDKADLLVQRDRPCIIGVHIEFDADEAGGPRLRQGRLDEPQPETTPGRRE